MRTTFNPTRISITFCALLMGIFSHKIFAQTDSTNSKHYVGLGILGNNYLPPFHKFGMDGYFLTSFSFNYSYQQLLGKSCLQLNVGVSPFVAEWYDTNDDQWIQPYIAHRTWGVTLPVGLLYRLNYKPSGFWLGIAYTSAFGTQQFTYNPTSSSMVVKTIKYDGQIMPNLVYQLSPGEHRTLISFFYSPKFIIARSAVTQYYNWEVLPFYGGIMISSTVSKRTE